MLATVEIEVIGSRKNHKCEAIIDTGFTGYVSLHQDVAKTLGLELVAIEPVQLGDGRRVNATFCDAAVTFLDETAFVPIMLNRCKKAMIGTMLLAGCSLSIDFETGEIRIVRKSDRKSEK